MSGHGEDKRLSRHRAAIVIVLAMGLAFTLLACPAVPSGIAGTPVAVPSRATPGRPVASAPASVPAPTATPTPASPASATAVPSPSPTGSTASAIVAGRPLPLRAQDFDLVEVAGGQPQEPPVLLEAREADLDGDGTSEVFAQIAVGPFTEGPPGTGFPYRVHYGLFSYDVPRGRWASLRQAVALWRPPSRFEPFQMWAEFADLTGAGHKQILLYSKYDGSGQHAQLEVLSLSGRRLSTLLTLNGRRFYAVRDGQVLTLLEPITPPPLATGDGPAILVASKPADEGAGCCPAMTLLSYFAWDGRQFVRVHQDEREGYPALPTPLP